MDKSVEQAMTGQAIKGLLREQAKRAMDKVKTAKGEEAFGFGLVATIFTGAVDYIESLEEENKECKEAREKLNREVVRQSDKGEYYHHQIERWQKNGGASSAEILLFLDREAKSV